METLGFEPRLCSLKVRHSTKRVPLPKININNLKLKVNNIHLLLSKI